MEIRTAVRTELGITISAGIAPNKFLAKIASAWQKPDGLTVVAPERVEPFLKGLSVEAMWGVGPVTAEKLRQRGVRTVGEVASLGCDTLVAMLGAGVRRVRLRHDRQTRHPEYR